MSESDLVANKELLSAQNLYLSGGGPTAITFSNGGAVVDLDSTDSKDFRQTVYARTFTAGQQELHIENTPRS